MKSIKDFIVEKKEFDEEIAINITNEITDIIDDISKTSSPGTIQQIIENILSRYINCEDGVSKDASIAVGDAVLNIYEKYIA